VDRKEFAAPLTLERVGVGRVVDAIIIGDIPSTLSSPSMVGVREGRCTCWRLFFVGEFDCLIEGVVREFDAIDMWLGVRFCSE